MDGIAPSAIHFLFIITTLSLSYSFRSPRNKLRFISELWGKYNRPLSTRCVEEELWKRCIPFVIGADESGCGSLAGPIVAAAVFAPRNSQLIAGVDDSKRLTEKKRNVAYNLICQDASILSSIAVVNVSYVDNVNSQHAALEAIRESVERLYIKVHGVSACLNEKAPSLYELSYALIDGKRCPKGLSLKSRGIPLGDSTCYSIALASIIATAERDKIMHEYDAAFPDYGFARHKGYATREHVLAIHKHGALPSVHRMSTKLLRGR